MPPACMGVLTARPHGRDRPVPPRHWALQPRHCRTRVRHRGNAPDAYYIRFHRRECGLLYLVGDAKRRAIRRPPGRPGRRRPSFLLGGSVLVTGEVARTTGYEPGFPPQDAWLDGAWAPDPLVLDDQALMINVSGKGLVVLTGCGHAGIVNICRYARRLTGDQPLYAAMGGFHLNGPLFEPLIRGCSMTWRRWRRRCWCPRTAPDGEPSTRWGAASAKRSCRTPSAPASPFDGRPHPRRGPPRSLSRPPSPTPVRTRPRPSH